MNSLRKIKEYIDKWSSLETDDLSLWIASGVFWGIVAFVLVYCFASDATLLKSVLIGLMCGFALTGCAVGPILFALLLRVCKSWGGLFCILVVSHVGVYKYYHQEKTPPPVPTAIMSTVASYPVESEDDDESDVMVYICPTGSSYAYHRSPYCGALSQCSRNPKKITLSMAESIGRTPCHRCY